MNGEKPFIEQMKENVPSGEEMQKNISEGAQNIGDSLNEMKDNMKESLNDFSNKTIVDASNDFLDSNSLLAKFAFIVLIVIIFMILLKILMSIMGYFLAPSGNPYIIKGALSGSDRQVIPQDPSKDDTIQVLKSNDRHRGLEYTWSVWLFLNEGDSSSTTKNNVFVKGDPNFDTDGINLINGPGMYLDYVDISGGAANTNEYNLVVVMDHLGGQEITGEDSGRDTLTVQSIPTRKWVHVAIRAQNTILDVYVNGTIAKRHNMIYAPKLNFQDIVVCGGSGFKGKLSDLRYYSYALNVFELTNIVMFGPDTRPSELSVDSRAKTGTYSYLSNVWYSNKA